MSQLEPSRSFELRSFRERGIDVLRGTVRQGSFDPHFHDSYLIGFTLEGVESFVQDGKPGLSLPGQVRLVPPGGVHTGEPGSGQAWRYLAFYVSPATLAEAAERAAPPIFAHAVITDPQLFAAGLAFAQAVSKPDEGARDEAQSALFHRLVRYQLPPKATAPEPRKIALARDYIRHRMASSIRLDELAAAVGLSKFHLLRTFKLATGLTPWRYQVQLRLATARALLREGTPASQVAVICGFFDQSHFTRLFRASYGITPAAYAAACAIHPLRADR